MRVVGLAAEQAAEDRRGRGRAGAGITAGFFAAFLAGFAFFAAFFLRAGARFVFLGFFAFAFAFRFFAMISLPIGGSNLKVLPNPRPRTAALLV